MGFVVPIKYDLIFSFSKSPMSYKVIKEYKTELVFRNLRGKPYGL